MAKDSITVQVGFNSKSEFFIPNAFTPNGDGINDCLGLRGNIPFKEFEFFIYNRWGLKVFEYGNSNNCWNGDYLGKKQEGGAYVFVLKGKSDCGNVEKVGTVILIR